MSRARNDERSGPWLEMRGIEKRFRAFGGDVSALAGVDLHVPSGQFLTVMGRNGSGKSQLLNILAGLDRPTRGWARIGGVEVTSLSRREAAQFRRRHIGLVFQFFNLAPSLTIEENVALPALLEGRQLADLSGLVRDALDAIGLSHRRNGMPASLSGGEMQRLAIARAMLLDPTLLLIDDAISNLDSRSGEEVLALLRNRAQERGTTTLLLTHDVRAASYSDRIVVLRNGRIEEDLPVTYAPLSS